MSFYDANIYKNHHKAYVSQEPPYGSPTNSPKNTQRPMMMIRNSESYAMAKKTEQVVKYGREDHDSPTKKELYKDHGAGVEKDHSPRLNNFGIGKRTSYNTPDYGKYTHLSSDDDDDDDDDDNAPKYTYTPPPPLKISYAPPPPKNSYAPPPPSPPKTSYAPPPPPPKTSYAPPPKNSYSPSPPPPPKNSYDPSLHSPPKNSYAPTPHSPPKTSYAPPPSPPKTSYAPPPPPRGYPVPQHDNGYAPIKLEPRPQIIAKPSGNAPLPGYTTPYNDHNKERTRDDEVDNDRYVPPRLKIIPQIKTRIGDPQFAKGSPTKRGGQGYQEFIDSTEARRRYSGPFGEEMYTGTIDCKAAAKKYNGIFVP